MRVSHSYPTEVAFELNPEGVKFQPMEVKGNSDLGGRTADIRGALTTSWALG